MKHTRQRNYEAFKQLMKKNTVFNAKKIAENLEVSEKSVYRFRKKYTNKSLKKAKTYRQFIEIIEKTPIVEQYGITISDQIKNIAKAMQVSEATVYRHKSRYDLSRYKEQFDSEIKKRKISSEASFRENLAKITMSGIPRNRAIQLWLKRT